MVSGRVRTGIWLAITIASLVMVACGQGTVYLVPALYMHGLHLKSAFIIEGLYIEVHDDCTHELLGRYRAGSKPRIVDSPRVRGDTAQEDVPRIRSTHKNATSTTIYANRNTDKEKGPDGGR